MSRKAGTSRVLLVHPDEPDSKLAAYLTWSPGTAVKLKIDLIPNPRPAWLSLSRIPRLHVAWPEPMTLFEVLNGGTTSGMGVNAAEFEMEAPLALFGGLFESHVPVFNYISVEVFGCASWFGVHGFKRFVNLGEPNKILTIEYDSPKTQKWTVTPEEELGYEIITHFTRTRHPVESVAVFETPTLSISSGAPSTVDTLLRSVTKAMSFVEFATDESVWIERVHVAKEDEPNAKFEVGAAWKQEPRPDSPSVMWLFPYTEVQGNFGEHIGKWFELYADLPLALDLYSVCKRSSELQAEFRFFSIASALESLHRSLYAEGTTKKCSACKRTLSMSFEERLRDVVNKHQPLIRELLTKQDCKLVADTRNYLAHQTPALALKAIPSRQLFGWCRRLLMVFEICLLSKLPFTRPGAVINIIDRRWATIKSGMLGEWQF